MPAPDVRSRSRRKGGQGGGAQRGLRLRRQGGPQGGGEPKQSPEEPLRLRPKCVFAAILHGASLSSAWARVTRNGHSAAPRTDVGVPRRSLLVAQHTRRPLLASTGPWSGWVCGREPRVWGEKPRAAEGRQSGGRRRGGPQARSLVPILWGRGEDLAGVLNQEWDWPGRQGTTRRGASVRPRMPRSR